MWFQPGNNLNKASKYLYCILLVNGVYIYYANYATDIHNKLITKNLNIPVHLFQLNWYTLLGTYMYSHTVHIFPLYLTVKTYTNKVLNWSTLNDNILAVGIILLEWAWELYTRPNHHYDIKLLKGDLRKEPWVVIDKISKKYILTLNQDVKK